VGQLCKTVRVIYQLCSSTRFRNFTGLVIYKSSTLDVAVKILSEQTVIWTGSIMGVTSELSRSFSEESNGLSRTLVSMNRVVLPLGLVRRVGLVGNPVAAGIQGVPKLA